MISHVNSEESDTGAPFVTLNTIWYPWYVNLSICIFERTVLTFPEGVRPVEISYRVNLRVSMCNHTWFRHCHGPCNGAALRYLPPRASAMQLSTIFLAQTILQTALLKERWEWRQIKSGGGGSLLIRRTPNEVPRLCVSKEFSMPKMSHMREKDVEVWALELFLIRKQILRTSVQWIVRGT